MIKVGGGIVIGAIFGAILGIILVNQGLSLEEIKMTTKTGNATLTGGLVIGFTLSIIGGFFTTKIAQSEVIKHTVILGTIGLVIDLLFYLLVGQYPKWYLYSSYILGVPFAVLGGIFLN